jgi:protein TonB
MTDFALMPEVAGDRGNTPSGPPHVNPPWLRPAAITAIVAAHLAVFGAFLLAPPPKSISLDSLTMDLVQEGDFIEQEEQSAAEDTPPPVAVEQPDLALPPPVVMAPDAIPLAMKKEDVEKVEKRQEQKQVERAQQRREAQQRRRAGAPEAGGGSGAASASCLAHVAASLRQHTPGSTSLGPGHAHVTFHVNSGGGISGVSASGSTPGHAALARRIVSSSHGPGNCGSAFVSQAFAFH